jgi:hypothetical protein
VYPGCPQPPTTFGSTWYFDAVNGHSQVANGGDPGGGLGTSAAPWKDPNALFGAKIGGILSPIPGYTQFLLSTVHSSGGPVHPGDKVVLMNGNYGALQGGGVSSAGDEIINVPALTIVAGAGQTPVLTYIGINAITGLVLNGLKVQANGNYALIVIQDGTVAGVTNSNIILENMDVSSDTVTNAATWTQAQWQSNARDGIYLSGSNNGTGMDCESVVNSHIYVVGQHGGSGISLFGGHALAQNNEVDHFDANAISYLASNVAVLHNNIHDVFDAGIGDNHSAVQGLSTFGNVITQSNIFVCCNKIIDQIDPTFTTIQTYLNGISAFTGDWENVVLINNLIATSACTGVNTGTAHDGLVANNSVIDGGRTALEPGGCALGIVAAQGHSGTTGNVGLTASNIRVMNNIAPTLVYGGINVQADHNIGTFAGYQYTYSTANGPCSSGVTSSGACYEAYVPGSFVAADAVSGINNYKEGRGQGSQFTTVPTPGSFPMSPIPNFTPLSGSPAKTVGGATLIPPLTDFNGAVFTPPYSIGGLN